MILGLIAVIVALVMTGQAGELLRTFLRSKLKAMLSIELNYKTFKVSWDKGIRLQLLGLEVGNPALEEGDGRKWTKPHLLTAGEVALGVDLPGIVKTKGKIVGIHEVRLHKVEVSFDKPQLSRGSNFDELIARIDANKDKDESKKEDPKKEDEKEETEDKKDVQVHKLSIREVGATAYIKGVPTSLRIADIVFDDFMAEVEKMKSGRNPSMVATMVSIILKSILKSVAESLHGHVCNVGGAVREGAEDARKAAQETLAAVAAHAPAPVRERAEAAHRAAEQLRGSVGETAQRATEAVGAAREAAREAAEHVAADPAAAAREAAERAKARAREAAEHIASGGAAADARDAAEKAAANAREAATAAAGKAFSAVGGLRAGLFGKEEGKS